jgi:hypothetical protein
VWCGVAAARRSLDAKQSPQAEWGELALHHHLLEDEGATRITLGPLDPEAQIALISDVLGAAPDTALVELADGAGGNPFILAKAFRGLLDEGAITVADRQATGWCSPPWWGTPLDDHNVRRQFRVITEAAGLGKTWVPRELRLPLTSPRSGSKVTRRLYRVKSGPNRPGPSSARSVSAPS